MKKPINNKPFRHIVLTCHLFFAAIFMLQAQSSYVGAIPGEIDVSPMGAASYTIPIEVVPGTQGVQPNLSIVYNSMSGMGLLGMKWSLTGLSAVTRCGQNPYYDGDMTAIQFTDNDRFALDGNRLLMQSNGAYGKIDVPYATEVENFIRVVPSGGSNGKPEYFKAYTDDGAIIEYGNTADSKQTITKGAILSWQVNKITDANGNYMTFHYNLTNREIRIDSIKYTGNGKSGMPTYAKVVFTYIGIPAGLGNNTAFVAGYGVPQTQLLRAITVYYNNTPVRKYRFNYMHETEQNETTAHLKEIVLSCYNDKGTAQELNATTIKWGTQNSSFETETINNIGEGFILTGDYDGDGYTDIVSYDTKYFYLHLNNHNLVFLNPYSFDWITENLYAYDLDMDGKDEIILEQKDGDTWTFYCLHFFPYDWCEIGKFKDFEKAYFGKFHSSGAPDMLFLCDAINQGSILYDQSHSPQIIVGQYEDIYITDLNGNGKDDIQIVRSHNGDIYEYQLYNLAQSDAPTLIDCTTGFPTKWHSVYYGDFNGDGIQDALVYCEPKGYSSLQWFLHIGIGNCVFMHPDPLHVLTQLDATAKDDKPKYPVMIADMNGDGKDEIIQLIEENSLPKFAVCYLNNFSTDGSCTVSVTKIDVPNILDLKNLDKNYFRLGDFNGDGKADILARKEKKGPLFIVYTAGENQYEFTKQITDGMGKEMKLSYIPQYFKAVNQTPALERKYFLTVVDSLQISNGIGKNMNFWLYEYKSAAYSFPRRTFLGFGTFDCINTNGQDYKKETRTFTFINNKNPKHILVPAGQFLTRKKNGNEETISSNTFTYVIDTLPNNRFVSRCSVAESRDLLQNTKVRTIVENNNRGRIIKKANFTYESAIAPNGNWTHVDTTIYFYKGISLLSNSYHKKTVLEKSLTRQIYNKNSNQLLVDTLTYGYTAEGRLAWERKGNSDGSITTTYGNYLIQGIYKEKTVTAGGISRKETYDYDVTRRFMTSIQNALGHTTTFIYDGRTGNKTKETDPNGLITAYKYNVFGNLTLVTYPDGTKTKDTALWYSNIFLPNAIYRVITSTPATPDVTTYHDLLGREICRLEDGAYYETQYNNLGQVVRTSYPLVDLRETRIWHQYTYDVYGRKVSEKAPYINLSYSYTLRKVTITDSLRNNIQSFKDYDALGRITQAKDEGGTITYQYDVINGNNTLRHQTQILVPNGGATTIVTDLWGNRLSIDDPNAGIISSEYNKLNELIKQTDANNNITTYQYDTLGRVKQKKFKDLNNISQTIDYIYDAPNKGKGKLYKIKVDGVETEIFSYDNLSRLYQHQKKIDNTFYTQTHTYNTNGQLQTLTYPDGFQVTYNYSSATGKLLSIQRSDDLSNSLIYYVHFRNKYNQPTQCEYGNEVVTEYEYNPYGLLTRIKTGKKNTSIIIHDTIYYDKGTGYGHDVGYTVDSTILNYRYNYNNRGLMNFRSESIVNRLETFTYDSLDRLTSITAGVIGQVGVSRLFSYHSNGNILNNSLLGNYSYMTNGSNKPHAVTEILPLTNRDISTNQCDVIYNYFNQPTQITDASTTFGYRLNLFYNANQQRNKTMRYKYTNNNYVLENTHIYFNKRYEEETDSITRHYHYIYGDNGVVALHIARWLSGVEATDSMYYIHTDHLGSYCALTNATKKTVQHNYFDPWGTPFTLYRGTPPGEPQELLSINFSLTTRGFTGHEHYPYFQIINMNGRLYDPVIGRFFSPDKYVANSSFTQDFNRYSYARNCPLMYTDPNGEFAWFIPLIAIAVSATVAATSYTIQVAASSGGFDNWNWDAFGANMMMGIGQGLITSGIGGAFGSVGSLGVLGEIGRAGAHAVVGGMFSEATGGNFWTGAATSFASSLVGSATAGAPIWAQIGASTITGGVTSKLSGGTFWQGAVNGFMVSSLNHAAHGIENTIEANKYVKSTRAFLEDLGFPSEQVAKDVVRHPSAFWGKYYAKMNNFENYKSVFTGEQYDSYSKTHDAWLSASRELQVGKHTEDYALKYYPSRNLSLGIVRTGAYHYIEAGLEAIDGFVRWASGNDNVIYDMHGRNAERYLKYR